MQEELKKLLEQVSDTYSDFVRGMICFCDGENEITKKVIQYMKDNPNATTSDILEYHEELTGPKEIIFVDDDELDEEE